MRSRTTFGRADAFGMARLQVLGVVTLWLIVASFVVRARLRQHEDRHWLVALETLRRFETRY